MNNPHTPGPWTFGMDIGSTPSRVTFRIGGERQTSLSSERGITCSNSNVLMSVAEAEANARLISAAPELLAALQGMFNMNLDAIELGEPFDEKLWEQAEQAIVKATGGAT